MYSVPPATITIQDFFKSPTDKFDIHIHSQEEHGYPHNHDFVELLYVAQGSLQQNINGAEWELTEGECCLLDLHSVHHIHHVSSDSLIIRFGMQKSFFNYHFIEMIGFATQNSFLHYYLDAIVGQNIAKEYLLFHTGSNSALHEITKRILFEYTHPDFCIVPVLLSNLYLMFFELIRSEKMGLMEQFQDSTSQGLSLVLNYISKHCTDCTLSDVAAHFGYTSGYLGQLLKKQYQKTFQEIRMEFRLLKSARLLVYTLKPVQEIAAEVGYLNLSYYYRIFREQFGMTPQEYRQLPQEKRVRNGYKILSLTLPPTRPFS